MTELTVKSVLYVASLEGMVQEMYKDSEGISTWALGVTNRSGHQVDPRYKDNPQPLQKCCDVSVWLMRNTYLPTVLKAFGSYQLQENELAAALSFEWNTGASLKTNWIDMVQAGDRKGAKAFLQNHYLNGGDLKARRMAEAALFFDNQWPASLLVPLYPVRKPSYKPNFSLGKKVDLSAYVKAALVK